MLALLVAAGCSAPEAAVILPEPETQATPTLAVLPTKIIITPKAPPPTVTAVPTTVFGLRGEPERISATDPRIRYVGRVDFSNPGGPAFDWSATTIEARFTGTTLGILLQDGRNQYEVIIDGVPQVLVPDPTQDTYIVAGGLPDEPHTVRIVKRTEALSGAGVFNGFLLDAGQDLLEPPPPAERLITFVGDSITMGYGVEGDDPTCFFTPDTENVLKSFAGMTADAFGADFNVLGFSGLGVVRSLGGDQLPGDQMIDYLDRTLALNPFITWEYSTRAPDAIAVNLGTNDFAQNPLPEADEFTQGYVELLVALRERYPDAPIFALAGPIMYEGANWMVETAVSQARTQLSDDRIHYVLIENTLELSAVDYGCEWHPNVSGQQKIVDQLLPVMSDVLGWEVR